MYLAWGDLSWLGFTHCQIKIRQYFECQVWSQSPNILSTNISLRRFLVVTESAISYAPLTSDLLELSMFLLSRSHSLALQTSPVEELRVFNEPPSCSGRSVSILGTVSVDFHNFSKTRTLDRTQSILCMGKRLGMRKRCPLCVQNMDA